MSRYVDGFVIPVPQAKLDEYRAIAEKAGALWKEHGALEYIECVGDDLAVENMLPFTKLANTTPDETVVFSWIVFKSREHRDEVNARVIADPRMQGMCNEGSAPFDCSRMAYGGFKTFVEA